MALNKKHASKEFLVQVKISLIKEDVEVAR